MQKAACIIQAASKNPIKGGYSPEHTIKAFDAVVIGASEPNEAAFILFKEQPVELIPEG